MASQPNPLPPNVLTGPADEEGLSYDEGWTSSKASSAAHKEAYAEVAGSYAFIRAEPAAWDEGNPR